MKSEMESGRRHVFDDMFKRDQTIIINLRLTFSIRKIIVLCSNGSNVLIHVILVFNVISKSCIHLNDGREREIENM